MNESNFTYTGNVRIRVDTKTYRYRNAGTDTLFELLARCLCGVFPDIIELPGLLNFCSIASDGSKTNLLLSPVQIQKAHNDLQCVITATIKRTHLIESKPTASYKSYKFELLNGDESDPITLATIELDNGEELLSQIQSGRQAFIEWSLSITNGFNHT